MPQYSQIIWDWNGTLLDDAWLCIEIINGLLDARGLPMVTQDSYQEQFGFPVVEYYRGLGFDFSRESFTVLADIYTAIYDRRRFECTLHPRALLALDHFHRQGVNQYILSAYEHTRLLEMVAACDIGHFFTRLVGLDDCLASSKVAQGTQLMTALGCAPAEVLLIGDTLHDHEVAAAMGVECLLIPCGHQSHARLVATGASVVRGHEEILARVFGDAFLRVP